MGRQACGGHLSTCQTPRCLVASAERPRLACDRPCQSVAILLAQQHRSGLVGVALGGHQHCHRPIPRASHQRNQLRNIYSYIYMANTQVNSTNHIISDSHSPKGHISLKTLIYQAVVLAWSTSCSSATSPSASLASSFSAPSSAGIECDDADSRASRKSTSNVSTGSCVICIHD
jgi:hypothetical protein